ncbi:hypothetical protein QEZ52_22160 (plasmid) [Aliisedimentitalea scapharcae]|uniref:Uncharacterized protein n=1 Tax=Aliisedimentitalea scapharcae TaxID=1524259 RepID=A0ABZ2Y1C5_9RHOB
MPQTVMVNYHVHSPRRQAFHIDAGGVVGTVVSPELGETEVPLRNLRGPETDLTFARDGVAFISAPTRVRSFVTVQEWQTDYDAELTAPLTRGVGTKEVAVFNITTIRAAVGWVQYRRSDGEPRPHFDPQEPRKPHIGSALR